MKYCEEYAALLDLYVDAELTAEEAQRVEIHLAECPACRAYVDDALAMRAAFADLEDVPVPEGFADSVCAAIRAQAAPRKAKKPLRWSRVLAPLAACCAVVILLRFGPVTGKGDSASMMKSAASPAAFDTAAAESMPAETECATEDSAAFSAQDADSKMESNALADTIVEEAAAEDAPVTEPAENGSSMSAAQEKQELAPETPQTSGDDTTTGQAKVSTLFLPAEAAEFMAEFTPAEETETQLQYRLFLPECERLQARLDEAGIEYLVEVSFAPPDEAVLVTLSK